MLLVLACATSSTGCVKRELYEQALVDLRESRQNADRLGAQIVALQRQVAQLTQERDARDAALAQGRTLEADQARKIEDLLVLNAELTERLKNAGQSVEQLATERGDLSKALADTRAQLVELRKQQAAESARAAQLRDLFAKFQKMIDAGKLKVVLRQGRMLLELPNDVLFDSGRTDIKPAGRTTIADVAKVLRTMPDRKFQVAGHTDNVRIQSARFPSNWELSTARAVEVTRLLVDSGMDPKNLSAAGYGEFAPAESNDTPEGRAKNRRIEIALLPSLDEFVKVPGAGEPPAPPPPKPAAPGAKPAPPPAKPPAPATPAPKPQDFGDRQ